jgi:hypothetical protein
MRIDAYMRRNTAPCPPRKVGKIRKILGIDAVSAR